MPPIQSTQTPSISLKTDFGHAPLGKLGSKSVEIGQTTAPRSTPAGDSAKSLLSRIANALTPQSSRTDSKFRQDLGKVSENLSNCLGQIATGKDKGDITTGLNKLSLSLMDLQNRGANPNSVMDAQLKLKLSQMTPDELAALHMGLVDTKEMGIDSQNVQGKMLEVMLKAVANELQNRVQGINEKARGPVEKDLKPLVDKLIDSGAKETGAPGSAPGPKYVKAYEDLQAQALKMAKEMEPSASPKALQELKNGLIKEAMLSAMGDDPIPLAKAMSFWPGTEIAGLRDANPIYSSDGDSFPIMNMCLGQVGLRAQNFDTSINQRMESLLSRSESPDDPRSPINDPVGFAKDVIALKKELALSSEHHQRFDLKWDGEIDLKFGKVLEHLEGLVQDDNLNLSELSTKTFGEFRVALEKLELTGATESMKAEGERRLESAKKDYQQTLDNVFKEIGSESPAKLLVHLRELTEAGDHVLETLEATGGKYKGADDLMQLRGDWLDEAFAKMSPDELRNLHTHLSSKENMALEEALGSLGSSIISSGKYSGAVQDQGRQMFNATSNLQLFRAVLEDTMTKKGMELPPRVDHGELAFKDLNNKQMGAFSIAYPSFSLESISLSGTWTEKGFDRPLSLDDLMAKTRDKALQTAFESWCKKEFASENLDFMRFVRDMGPETSVESVKSFIAEFVGDKAPRQININGTLTEKLLTAAANLTQESLESGEIQDLMKEAYAVLYKEVKDGPYKNFMSDKIIKDKVVK